MEEINLNQSMLLTAPKAVSINNLTHLPYPYSSRHIQLQKQKSLQLSQQIYLINQPIYQKQKQLIKKEYQQLKEYISQLEGKFIQVDCNQIDWMSDKYRYYLGKFKKYYFQHQKLMNTYNQIQKFVIQSPSVQQEIKSINFIKMVSNQTNQKLHHLKTTVLQAETKKQQNQKHIQQLRKQLNIVKDQFFRKKRQQAMLKSQIQKNKTQFKMQQINRNMQKIRFQKRRKLEQIQTSLIQKSLQKQKIRHQKYDKPLQQIRNQNLLSNKSEIIMLSDKKKSSLPLNKGDLKGSLSDLKALNQQAQSYLKKLSSTCENFKWRKLQAQNKLKTTPPITTNIQNFRIKSRQTTRLKKKKQQLLTNQQIIKQLSINNQEKIQFRKKTTEEVMHIFMANNNLKQLVQLVQEEMRKENKQNYIRKRQVNIHKSQIYKSNSTQIYFQQDKTHTITSFR